MKQKRDWSDFQKAIFLDIAKGSGHTVVEALAGSGKTSTIVEGFKYVPRGKKVLMVAFNKSIAEELKERAPSYVDVFTLHALGFRAIRQAFGDVKLENRKCQHIVESLIGNDDWELTINICKAVSLCKGFLFDTPDKVNEVMDRFGIENFEMPRPKFIGYVLQAMRMCKESKQIIDFDDMIWFPFVYALNVGKFDVVFIDETQDLNTSQIIMALSACKKTGRIIAVGDKNQSIYQFRGADSSAMDNIIKKLSAKILPLSITYRCPQKIVKMAQSAVPAFMAAPNAKDGEIHHIIPEQMLKQVKPGDFILSRTNAPLIKYCMALLKSGVPANIQGRDIGSNLLAFIKKSKAKTIPKFIQYVQKWEKAEIERLMAEKKSVDSCQDKAECLYNLCATVTTIPELKETIDKLFNDVDDNHKVILSTTHKAKGLERDRVFVLANTYKKGLNQEETNLWYVAITRAKSDLFMVNKTNAYQGGGWKGNTSSIVPQGDSSTLMADRGDFEEMSAQEMEDSYGWEMTRDDSEDPLDFNN